MDDIINIIEGEHDTFTVTTGETRLSDAIDDFKQSEAIQYAESISKVLSAITERTVNPDLMDSLRDGTVLCLLLEKCVPTIQLGKWHHDPKKIVAFESENIFFFSKACISLGMHQTSIINYNVFINHDMHQLVTCLINLFKLLYPTLSTTTAKPRELATIEVTMGDILESSGTITREDRERIQQEKKKLEEMKVVENESINEDGFSIEELAECLNEGLLEEELKEQLMYMKSGKREGVDESDAVTPATSHLNTTVTPATSHLNTTVTPATSQLNTTVTPETSHLNTTVTPATSQLNTTVTPETSHLNTTVTPATSHLNTTVTPATSHLNTTVTPATSHLNTTVTPATSQLNTTVTPATSHLNTTVTPETSQLNETPSPQHVQEENFSKTSDTSFFEQYQMTPSQFYEQANEIPVMTDTMRIVEAGVEDKTEENRAFIAYLEEEEKSIIAEMERLQREDEERIERERKEREKQIEEIRNENGLISSDDEKWWDEEDQKEEEEESRRRTIFVKSLKTELAAILTEVKMNKKSTKEEIRKKRLQVQKKLEEDDQRHKRELQAREKRLREKRTQSIQRLSKTDQKEKERKVQLRQERKAYEKQLKQEEEEQKRLDREKKKKEEEERRKKMNLFNKQKEEEKKRNAEKKRLWLEEKRRLEEEEKRKEEIEQQKKRERLKIEQNRRISNQLHSPYGSPRSPPRQRKN